MYSYPSPDVLLLVVMALAFLLVGASLLVLHLFTEEAAGVQHARPLHAAPSDLI
jgi:CHASE3 domain sensor protein